MLIQHNFFATDTNADEAVPHKKRRLFRLAGEKDVGSSSDGEASDSSHKGINLLSNLCVPRCLN